MLQIISFAVRTDARPMSIRSRPARAHCLWALALCLSIIGSRPCEACFSIVVGKNASTDGCVIVAHNEDDEAPEVVNHHKVPRHSYPPGSTAKLRNGGSLEQVEQTWAYIWSEMPGQSFSDSYVNEWGVTVASDNCPSREDKPELTAGGIGYMLRRLVVERAKTAREGVLLAGGLVERFGYVDSGRTYIIADPNEGWLLCVVNGKHWLARRVPDDEVAMVANTYTIHRVTLEDKANFLASADIIDYAKSRGWYNPQADDPFDFAKAYANPKAATSPNNTGRQWSGLTCVDPRQTRTRPESALFGRADAQTERAGRHASPAAGQEDRVRPGSCRFRVRLCPVQRRDADQLRDPGAKRDAA